MHKHNMFVAMSFVLGTAVSAAAQPTRPPAPVPSPRAGIPSETPDRSALAADETFARKAVAGGQAEVELAVVAQQKASNDNIKQLAQKIEADHKKANDELMAIVNRKNLNIDPKPTAEQIQTRLRLEKLNGAEFDRAYLDTVVKEHEKSIKDFERHMTDGADPELKVFATKWLPELKTHLKMTQDAQRGLASTSQR